MPLSPKNLSRGRVDFTTSLSAAEVDSLVADADLKVLQTAKPVERETWKALNDHLFSVRPDVQLRVYGISPIAYDLSFVDDVPNVRNFSADCLMRATGVEHLESLGNLRCLTIGIFDLTSFDFLSRLNAERLEELGLQATKSKKPTLAGIERFGGLKTLCVTDHHKGIEVLSRLALLESLRLRSITVENLDFLRGLERLWSVDIKLGGTKNLAALEGMKGIKYLELFRVLGLEDISVVARMPGLQSLLLDSLPRVVDVPDLSGASALRRVRLLSMPGIKDVGAFAKVPNLEEFSHVIVKGVEPSQYAALLKRKSLKRVWVRFGADRKDKEFDALAAKAGVNVDWSEAFVFA